MNPPPVPRESSSDSSSDDEAGRIGCLVEEDPSKVIFHFLKTGMAL